MFPFKIFIHQTNDTNVKFGYRFITPEFIPKCFVTLYLMNNESIIDSFIGSSKIDESQTGDEIDIIIGSTTLLEAKVL